MVSPGGRPSAPAFVVSPAAGLTARRSAFTGATVAATSRTRVASVVDRRVRVTAAAAGPAAGAAGRVHVVQPAAGVSRVVGGDRSLTRSVEQAATVGTPALPLPGGGYGLSAVFMALAGAAALFNRKPKRAAAGEDGVVEPEVVTSMAASANGAAAGAPKRSLGDKLKDMIPTPQERKKLGPLALMFFVILFNYTILRDTKDVLVVTAAGAEVIPFLKTYCNLPGAVLFTILYSKLNNSLTREQVFYTCIVPFIIFFLAFGFIIYPNTAALHPIAWSAWAATKLPVSFAPLLAIVRNWTFALFYTLAELWGSVVVSVLFWGFANEVTTVEEAKKYYPLFGLGANVALVFSGQYVRYVSDIRAKLPPGVDGWAVSLKYLMAMIAAGGAVIMGCFYYMQRKIIPDPELFEPRKSKGQSKKKKTQMTLGESAKFLASSPYIRNMALLVIAYGSAINIVEVSFKSHLKTAFPDPNAYSAFMGNFSSVTGVVTLVMMLVGRWVFRHFGWGVAAAITPIVLGITGIGFFALTLFAGQAAPLIALAGTTPLMAAVFVGAAQVIMSKACKYSCFDPSKEMLYISLDETSRNEGKAAIDVIGNPLGKSGGSFVQQVLIFATGSLAASTPYLAVILVGIIGMWLVAAKSLDKQFSAFMRKETAAAREKMKGTKAADEGPAAAAGASS